MNMHDLQPFVRQDVDVRTASGSEHHGQLLSVTTRSCWLVNSEDQDVVLPTATVSSVSLHGTPPPDVPSGIHRTAEDLVDQRHHRGYR